MTKNITPPGYPTPSETRSRPRLSDLDSPVRYPRCTCAECLRKLDEGDPNALYTAHDMTDAYMRGLLASDEKHDG